jgi:cytochrome c553
MSRKVLRAGGQSSGEILVVKEQVRERDGYACTRCGMSQADHLFRTGRRLDVHRTTPGSLYTLEGSVTICRGCHGAEPKRAPGQPDLANPKRDGRPVAIRGPLADALAEYAKEQERSFASVVRLAVREFLIREGRWPPKPEAAFI